MPTIPLGSGTAAAIAVTEREEVLVARTVSGPQAAASRSNRFRFRSRSSGAASITRSQSFRTSMIVSVSIRSSASIASCSLQRPRSAPGAGHREAPQCPAPVPCCRARRSRSGIRRAPRSARSPRPSSRRRRRRRLRRTELTQSSAVGRDHRVDPGRVPPDDQLVDLGGALVQRGDPGVAEVALDRVVVDVAGSAVHLDGCVGALDGGLGRVVLRDRGLDRVADAAVLELAGAVDQQPGGVPLDDHVGDQLLDELEARDRDAELPALLRVVDRGVDAAVADPDAAGGDAVAAVVESAHRDLEAVADLAEQGVVGDLDVVERDLRRVR